MSHETDIRVVDPSTGVQVTEGSTVTVVRSSRGPQGPPGDVVSVDGRAGVVTLDDLYAPVVHAGDHAVGGPDELGADYARLSDPFGFGLIYTVDPNTVGDNRTLATANDCWFARVFGGGTITKIATYINVQSGNISVAVYRNTGTGRSAAPGTRLATSGAVACPTAGYAEVSLGASVVVQPGDWFAISADNTTMSVRCSHASELSTSVMAGRAAKQASAHPAPSAPSPTASSVRGVLLVGVA